MRYDDSAQALTLAEEGLTFATTLGDTEGVAAALTAKAFALFRLSRLREARECGERGRDLCGRLGDREGLAAQSGRETLAGRPANLVPQTGVFAEGRRPGGVAAPQAL